MCRRWCRVPAMRRELRGSLLLRWPGFQSRLSQVFLAQTSESSKELSPAARMREKIVRRAACEFKDGMWAQKTLLTKLLFLEALILLKVCQPGHWDAHASIQLHPSHHDCPPSIREWYSWSGTIPHTWSGRIYSQHVKETLIRYFQHL